LLAVKSLSALRIVLEIVLSKPQDKRRAGGDSACLSRRAAQWIDGL